MILPFVRELFADVEKSSAFARAVTQVKGGAGRIRVSGLTPTGKALFYSLLHRATARPLIVIVSDNRALDELLPVVRSLGELTGAVSPEAVVGLPAYDVLPFENLSPHPEIQEARATALWKIATGAASVVITPVAATAMRLRDAGFYADLAKVVRRGEMVDPEQLIEHLRIVGYNQVDVVEMPGEFAHRGGLLDVYPPELDRPVRIELFGDEVESIRKFDPSTQRSAATTEEVVLLPLTETPVEEETLAAINARLSRRAAGRRRRGDRGDGTRDRRCRVSGMGVVRARRRRKGEHLRSAAQRGRPARRTGRSRQKRTTPGGRESPKRTSAAWSAIWSVPKICTSPRSNGALACSGRRPSPSNNWASRAAMRASISPCRRSPPRASTARLRP